MLARNPLPSLDMSSLADALRDALGTHEKTPSSDGLVALLSDLGRRHSWVSGDILVRPGDAVDQVSLCLSGSFRVMINSADGQAMLLRFLKPG